MPGDNECGVGDQGVHAPQLPDVRAPIKREWYCEKMLKIVVEPVIIRRQKHLLRTRIHQRSRPETAAQRAASRRSVAWALAITCPEDP